VNSFIFALFFKTADKEKNHSIIKLDEEGITMVFYMQMSKRSEERKFIPARQTFPRDHEWV